MSIQIRQLTLPSDYEAVARLVSMVTQRTVTAGDVEEQDRSVPMVNNTGFDEHARLTGFCRERAVAVDDDGNIVGYVASWRAPWSPSGQLGSYLSVETQERNRGIGSALLHYIETWARSMGAHTLMSEVPDTLAWSRSFVEHRGYAIDRHLYQSTLRLDREPEVDATSIDESLHERGLRRVSGVDALREFGNDALYDLYSKTEQDIPGQMGSTPYDEWLEQVEKTPHDFLLVAVTGDRPIGVTHMTPMRDTTGVYNWYTGVDPDYRGCGVAKALKWLSIDIARKHGITFMVTDNDSENHGMLAVNRTLGYIPTPGGHYRVYKNLK